MRELPDIPAELLDSPEHLVVHLLPYEDRAVLRRLAVPRFVDPDNAAVLVKDTALRERALNHPLLKQATWDVEGRTRIFDDGIREALLDTFFSMAQLFEPDDAQPAEEPTPGSLSAVHATLADYYQAQAPKADLETIYHRLGTESLRDQTLDDIETRIDALLTLAEGGPRRGRDEVDVAGAHDLLRVLEEWGRRGLFEAQRLHRRLSPRLVRRSRWSREREATRRYYARRFEADVWQRLLASDGRWILQLHAPGGAGKTMFVQNLVGRLCPAEEIPCARIDFDYVAHLVTATNQPWRILLLIARQLDRQIEGNPFEGLIERFGRFEARAFSPRQARRLEPAERTDPSSDTELLQAAAEVPELFRATLSEHLEDRPVVVVLDTLENLLETEGATLLALIDELARVYQGPNHAVDNDAADDGPTGGLSDRVPGLRLILAGRFDLAGERHQRWSSDNEELVERVQGFGQRYIGETSTQVDLPGTTLHLGHQVATLLLPRFDSDEARDYLATRCGVDDPEIQDAIVEKAAGNPMKLTLLADDPNLSASTIRAFRDTDLYYLVNRVIDRILDTRVQWLVRWGVVPRLLTRDFAERILWPLFEEHHGGERQLDEVTREAEEVPQSTSFERYAAVDPGGDFLPVWQRLIHYAASASWVSVVRELPDTLVFHPDVRDPMRGLLRRHDQAIYHELNRRALADWTARAQSTSTQERIAALRGMVFHTYEPWKGEGRPADPDARVLSLLDKHRLDASVAAEIAREVVDVARRASSLERDDLVAPAPEVLRRAHTRIAQFLAEQVPHDPSLVAQLRQHLPKSDLDATERHRVEGYALAAEGRHHEAQQAFTRALDDPDLDPQYRVPLLTDAGVLSRDAETLERVLELEPEGPNHMRALQALAEIDIGNEEYARAERRFATLGNVANQAQCLLWLGKPAAAERLLEACDPAFRDGLQILANLHSFRPQVALEAILRAQATHASLDQRWAIYQARALAELAQEDDALSHLEGLINQGDNLDIVAAAAEDAARLALGRDQPKQALRILERLPEDLPANRSVRLQILKLEAEAELGDVESAWQGLQALDATASDAWLPSTRLAMAVARLNFQGVDTEGLERLLEVLETLDSPSRRLFLLLRLTAVGTPQRPIERSLDRRLRALTRLGDDDGPRLVLARAELLRVLRRPEAARQLLWPLLSPTPDHVVWHHVRRCFDRVGWPDGPANEQPPTPESFPKAFRTRVDAEHTARLNRPPTYRGRFGLGPRLKPSGSDADTLDGKGVRGIDTSPAATGRDAVWRAAEESLDLDGRRGGGSHRGETLGVRGGDARDGNRGDGPPGRRGFGLPSEDPLPTVRDPVAHSARPPRDSLGNEATRGTTRFDLVRDPDPETARALGELVDIDADKSYVSTKQSRLLLSRWTKVSKTMGHGVVPPEDLPGLAMRSKPHDLTINLGYVRDAWIPWHLAEVQGWTLPRIPGVRAVIRSWGPLARDRPEDPGDQGDAVTPTRVACVAALSKGSSRTTLDRAEQVSSLWRRSAHRSEVSLFEGLQDRALDPEIGILHLVAPLEHRRGSAVLRLEADWGEVVGASQLARKVQERPTPLLVLLDVPFSGQIQTAQQLMLRELFADALLRELPQGHILATGLVETHPETDWLHSVIEGLVAGASLARITARLQRQPQVEDGEDGDGPDHPLLRQLQTHGSVLYSNRPDTRFRLGASS